MFEGLKKKFSSFIDSFSKKEEEAIKQEEKREGLKQIEEGVTAEQVNETPKAHALEEPKPKEVETPKVQHAGEARPKPVEVQKPKIPEYTPKPVEKAGEKRVQHIEPKPSFKQPEQKVTLGTKLKSIVFREVKVSHQDVGPFLEQLRMALLQSDVNYDVTEKILGRMESELTNNPIEAKNLQRNITGIIRNSILSVLNKGSDIDIVKAADAKKGSGEPFKVLFIGPNGAGKTTTMAKLAKMFMDHGFSCVLSASDTFRAAAIEQTVHHASKLGIHVIKGNYGADPASVAFDAIAYAKAHAIDVVLIDSAGRQETNKSLMEEIKKMARIAKPDMKIFVGESITGNALLGQVKEFDQAVKLDGIILTKLDADAKGGNTLSILSETDVPVLFFGSGEAYDAIIAYKPELIIDNIVPNN